MAPQIEIIKLKGTHERRRVYAILRDRFPGLVSIDGTVSDVAMFGYPEGKRPKKFKPLPSMYDMARGTALVVTRAQMLPGRVTFALRRHSGPTHVVLVFDPPEQT